MKRRNFLALVAALLPASWVAVGKGEPKVNSDEFCGCGIDTLTSWKCSMFVDDKLVSQYECKNGVTRQVFPV